MRVGVVDRLAVGGQASTAERRGVVDRIGIEEVLVLEAKADHLRGEARRIGEAGVAGPCVDVQQLVREVADCPVRVVGVHDDLDDVSDRPLQQLDELAGGGVVAARWSSSVTIGHAACAQAPLSR